MCREKTFSGGMRQKTGKLKFTGKKQKHHEPQHTNRKVGEKQLGSECTVRVESELQMDGRLLTQGREQSKTVTRISGLNNLKGETAI